MDEHQPHSPAKESKKPEKGFVADILQSVVIAIFVCIVIYLFIATPNQVSGDSMLPNFHNGELLLTNRISQWLGGTEFGHSIDADYHRGDVVVFQKPGSKDFIKRIIGLPGDSIMIKDGKVFVNGQLLHEDYIPPEVRTLAGSFLLEGDEKIVPEHHFFVMGDNRLNSQDSRYAEVGFVSRDWLKGKVIVRYWPLPAFSLVSSGIYELE